LGSIHFVLETIRAPLHFCTRQAMTTPEPSSVAT
jgi:hypothetical protein